MMNERTETSEPDFSVFDPHGALRQVDGDEEILEELAETFLDQVPGLLETIKESARTEEASELRRAAHTMKGSAAVFAAAPVVDAALRVETLAREERLDDAGTAIAELEPLVGRLTDDLRRFLEKR